MLVCVMLNLPCLFYRTWSGHGVNSKALCTPVAPSFCVPVCTKSQLALPSFTARGFGRCTPHPPTQRPICPHIPGCGNCLSQGMYLLTLADAKTDHRVLCWVEGDMQGGVLRGPLDLMLSGPAPSKSHSRWRLPCPCLTFSGISV